MLDASNMKDMVPVALIISALAATCSAIFLSFSIWATVRSDKKTRTMDLIKQWDSGNFFYARKAANAIIKEIKHKNTEERLAHIKKKIQEDIKSDGEANLDINITTVLNHFESLVNLIRYKFVHEEFLRDIYKTIIVEYFNLLEPWIQDMRITKGPRIYKGIEHSYHMWK